MGRIFKDCHEAINEIERDIMEMGIKVHPHTMQNKNVKDNDDFSTIEVQNYTFTILDMKDKDGMVGDCLEWCRAEIIERINCVGNPGEAWKLRKEVWEEFLVNGVFEYTYFDRLNREDQINYVIEELKNNPDSRQCIIHVHGSCDLKAMGERRIPCSMYYQLMIRRGALDIIYNMRSSDFDTHFRNDIWLANALRNYIAGKISVPVGLFHMNIGSLHRYKNYTNKVVF